MIVPLNFPKAPLNLVKRSNTIFVTCLVRKKQVKLTPEEWVRQHVIFYLIEYKKASAGLIAVEKSLLVNGLTRRFDVVVANREGRAKILIECKATEVQLTEETLFQLAQYNSVLTSEYVMITNGLQSLTAQINHATGAIELLEDLPILVEE
jgi:hypothetical protein